MKHVILALLFGLIACGREPTSVPDQTPAKPSAVERVVAHTDSGGWVISLDGTTPAHLGDSLLFTGLAVGLLPCKNAQVSANALLTMMQNNGGHLGRHPTDMSESDDGKFGVYWGLKRYLTRCTADITAWSEALTLHRTTVGTALHPQLDDVRTVLGDHEPLTDAIRVAVSETVRVWAALDVKAQAAAYRIHLGWLILDQIGTVKGVAQFCVAADPAGMQLVSAMCGDKAPLQAFVDGFVADTWEYALQRSPIWETSPDGSGLSTPGLDLLMAQDYLAR